MQTKKTTFFSLLNELYLATDATPLLRCDLALLGKKIGVTEELVEQGFNFLKHADLIDLAGMGYNCSVTQKGIDVIEMANTKPAQSTQYFPSIKEMGL